MNLVMDRGHLILGIILASVGCSTTGADDSEVELSAERSEFSAEQLVSGSLASFPSDAFDGLEDYNRDSEAGAIMANCHIVATIYLIGAVGNNVRCSLANADHSGFFLRDLSRIFHRTSIRLAVIDEKYYETELYFRVLLTRDGEETRIEYFANWGHDAESYGYDYQAPQRLYGWPHRQRKYPCGASSIISLVTVGADSTVRDDIELEVVRGNPSMKCLNGIERYLLESQYIPGRKGEKLIEARHMELWGEWRF